MCNCPFRYHFSLSDRADSNRLLCLKINQSNPRRKQLSALIKTNPTQSSAETNLLSIYLAIQSRSAETNLLSIYLTIQPRSRPKATCCWISLLPKSITLATESNLLLDLSLTQVNHARDRKQPVDVHTHIHTYYTYSTSKMAMNAEGR